MEHSRSSNKRFVFGIVLIVLGVILILERLNLIPESMVSMLLSWQMLLVGIGVLSLFGGNRTAGTILIVIGGFFMIPELITVPHEIRRIYWPLILVAIGIAVLLRQRDHSKITVGENSPFIDPNDPVSYTHLTLPTNREV